jgi:protein required for attachment to host cells
VKTTWVIVADASRARIFEASNTERALHEIETFMHPEGRAQNRELKTDGAGRYFSRAGAQAHTGGPSVDPAQHEMELFAKRLGEYLDKACGENRFEALYVVAPPKLLGLLRKNLSKTTSQLISETIPKDISWFDERELEHYLKDHGVAG